MRCPESLPDKETAGYQLLELVAISGELPADQLRRLPGGDAYKLNVVRALKSKKLLRTYYRNGLRGYRLTSSAKEALLWENPARFSFSLTGASETNLVKSEITRRLRLHRVAEATVTMMNADILFFRDEKPPIFSPVWDGSSEVFVRTPVFYNSREIKEIGTVFVKIRGARSVGVLLTSADIFVVYNLGDSLMKWEYKSEMRTKALMKTVLCRERLPSQYSPDAVQGLILGNSMELACDILNEAGGKQYFILDGNYEHFYFLTNDRKGEKLLKLLCSKKLRKQLEDILLTDLYEGNTGSTLENDAFDGNGTPVLFGYFCDLPRIRRFDTALRLQNKNGILICFDFQQDALKQYCSELITFQTIDFEKWERSFFE